MIIKKNIKLFIFFGVILRILAILLSPELGDVENYHLAGRFFLQTKTIYLHTKDLYSYPPVWIYYEAFATFISDTFAIPFVYVIKIPILVAEIGLMYLLFNQIKNKQFVILYALNPTVIFISSILGQFDSIVIFFALLSYIHITEKKLIGSGVFISFSVILKTYTVLLIPIFIQTVTNIKKKVLFIILAILPLSLLLLNSSLTEFEAVKRNLFSYSGAADYGWLGSMKALSAIIHSTPINVPPINSSLPFLLNLSKYFFIVSYAILFCYFVTRTTKLILQIILVFLLFYITVGGVGTQYFLWIIPFLLLYKPKETIGYTVISFLSILSYVAVQFYSPVLRHIDFFLFRTPFYLNCLYLFLIFLFWLYLIRLFYRLLKKDV